MGLLTTGPVAGATAAGPLRVHPDNPRYFTDGSGKAIYLTGSHTWSNFKDMGRTDPPPAFDFEAYLDFLQQHHHNFIRLWTWELSKYSYGGKVTYAEPFPWPRTGPGTALDGKPKFDLSRFDPAYFGRLRSRVAAAGERGLYVSIMLFEGHGLHASDAPWCWDGHPFNVHNNINGIDGDPNGDGRGLESQTLQIPAITALQEAYVRKVVDTVNDLDNVLYEIANESGSYSTEWQYHLIRFIHEYEKGKPKQHPVGMTFQWAAEQRGTNAALFDSPADWISPNPDGGYRDDPPAADGRKVILNDTDHLWGIGGNPQWVWKSFLRGLNPLFMDPYREVEGESAIWTDHLTVTPRLDPRWDPVRRGLGYTRQFAERLNLAAMTPRNDLASSTYCLANPGEEYLVYLPDGGEVTVDLAATGPLRGEWFNPTTGEALEPFAVEGGAKRTFQPPFEGDAVLYLVRAAGAAALTPSAPALPRLQVDPSGRFLVRSDGSPFFWLGDTAWWLLRLTDDDIRYYLANRAQKGFTGVQVDLNPYAWTDLVPEGEVENPFLHDNPDTPNERYWQRVDRMVDEAARQGLYLLLTPMWGKYYPRYVGNDPAKARRLGEWLGHRYRHRTHVMWFVSGEYDSINGYRPITPEQKALLNAVAEGLEEGHGGTQLMTIHPGGRRTSSADFHDAPWLDFNLLQTGHVDDLEAVGQPEVYTRIAHDYSLTPVKPVFDGEPAYEDMIDGYWQKRAPHAPRMGAEVVRRKAYQAVFAGACGHTYGHNDVQIFWSPGKPQEAGNRNPWREALEASGAGQMRHLRALMESRPFLNRIPDQSVLVSPAGSGRERVCATRAADGSYALVYLPRGGSVTIDLSKISGAGMRASWFDPRTGAYTAIGEYPNRGTQVFNAPGAAAWGNDGVLVLDRLPLLGR